VGEGRETAEGGRVAAGGALVVGGFGTALTTGFTNSVEVDSIALRSFGWGEDAALTSVGGGAASAFCFRGLGCGDATAFTRFGAGGPTISEAFEGREAIALTNLRAGVGAACKRSGEREVATFARFGEGAGFASTVEDEGDAVCEGVFNKVPLLGLGFAAGACKPVFGTEPE
jgi:hypothetical protein